MKGYWFSREDDTAANGSLSPAKVGEEHRHDGPIVPCKSGLHFSPTPWDALQYAQGPILWLVEGDDKAVPHGDPLDKFCGCSRRYLARVDMTAALRQFAAQQALSVIDKWDAPPVVREYLTDTASGKDRSDIRDAAGPAAAWDAVEAAARAAAWAAARAAAWAAARDAARDVAWDVARESFNELATKMLSAPERCGKEE